MKWGIGFHLWRNRVETAKSLFGILPKEADLQEARKERLEVEKRKNLLNTEFVINLIEERN